MVIAYSYLALAITNTGVKGLRPFTFFMLDSIDTSDSRASTLCEEMKINICSQKKPLRHHQSF